MPRRTRSVRYRTTAGVVARGSTINQTAAKLSSQIGMPRWKHQLSRSDVPVTTWASLKRLSEYRTDSSPTQGLPIDGKGHIQSSQDAEHDHAVRKRILCWLQTDFGFVIVLHSVQRGSFRAVFGRPKSVHWVFTGVVDFSGARVVPELLTFCCFNLYAGV